MGRIIILKDSDSENSDPEDDSDSEYEDVLQVFAEMDEEEREFDDELSQGDINSPQAPESLSKIELEVGLKLIREAQKEFFSSRGRGLVKKMINEFCDMFPYYSIKGGFAKRRADRTLIEGPCIQCLFIFDKEFRQTRATEGMICRNCSHQNACLEHFGTTHQMKCKEIRDKVDATCLLKFGTKCPLELEKFQQKSRETSMRKYNTLYPTQSEIVQATRRANSIAKRGVDHHMKDPAEVQKVIDTNYRRFGKKSAMQLPEYIEKRAENYLKKTGYRHHAQDPEWQAAHRNDGYKWKRFDFPNGKVNMVQGYEPHCINDQLRRGIDSDDIEVVRKLVPEVWYTFNESKPKRYFMDIYIKSENKAIEVKSRYTFNKEKEKNLAKQQAVKAMGMLCEIQIYNKKGDLLGVIY